MRTTGLKSKVQHIAFAIVIVIAVSAQGCSKSDNVPTGADRQTWTISGRTYLVGSEEPTGGVGVSCAGRSTTSRSDGSYELRDIPSGTQTLTAQKPGCIPYSETIEFVRDVTHHVFLDFKGIDLSGTVKNAVDGPIKDARVRVAGFVSYTDMSGSFKFFKIPMASDTLFVSHPNYFPYDTSLSSDAAIQRFDISLKRDSLIEITQGTRTYVDESLPDRIFGVPDRLYIRGNGSDSLGQYHSGIRRNIYMNFDFPVIFRYSSTEVLDASLDFSTDSSYSRTQVEAFSVTSSWTYVINWKNQPTPGTILSSGFVGDGIAAKYWTIVGTDGFKALASAYRATGQFYGVVIKGGGYRPVGFYSGLTKLNKPIIRIKVRY